MPLDSSPEIQQRYLTIEQATTYCGVAPSFIRRRLSDGSLDSFIVSGARRFTVEDLDEMMRRGRNRRVHKGRSIRKPVTPYEASKNNFQVDQSRKPPTNMFVDRFMRPSRR